jgi:hypothetical protein
MVKKSMKEGQIKITMEGPASAFRSLETKPHRKGKRRKTARVKVVHR